MADGKTGTLTLGLALTSCALILATASAEAAPVPSSSTPLTDVARLKGQAIPPAAVPAETPQLPSAEVPDLPVATGDLPVDEPVNDLAPPPPGDVPDVGRPLAPAPAAPLPSSEAVAVTGGAAVGAGLLLLAWRLARLASVGALAAPLFSRIKKHELLENDTRRLIHDVIVQNPGVSIRGIQERTGLGWGTLVHHLGRLESNRSIVSERNRQYRCFFKNGDGLRPAARVAVSELRNETARRLAVGVAEDPGVFQRELSRRVDVRPPVAHKHLTRLERAELLEAVRTGTRVQYYPTERLVTLLETHVEEAPGPPVPVAA